MCVCAPFPLRPLPFFFSSLQPHSLTPPPPPHTRAPPAHLQSKQPEAPLDLSTRPRARDIQRYLAVAAAMVGDELEEGALLPAGGAANERRKEAAAETDTLNNLRDKVKSDTAARAKIVAAEAAKAAALAALENMPVKK